MSSDESFGKMLQTEIQRGDLKQKKLKEVQRIYVEMTEHYKQWIELDTMQMNLLQDLHNMAWILGSEYDEQVYVYKIFDGHSNVFGKCSDETFKLHSHWIQLGQTRKSLENITETIKSLEERIEHIMIEVGLEPPSFYYLPYHDSRHINFCMTCEILYQSL